MFSFFLFPDCFLLLYFCVCFFFRSAERGSDVNFFPQSFGGWRELFIFPFALLPFHPQLSHLMARREKKSAGNKKRRKKILTWIKADEKESKASFNFAGFCSKLYFPALAGFFSAGGRQASFPSIFLPPSLPSRPLYVTEWRRRDQKLHAKALLLSLLYCVYRGNQMFAKLLQKPQNVFCHFWTFSKKSVFPQL